MMMMNFLVRGWRGWRWSDTLAWWLPSKTPVFEAIQPTNKPDHLSENWNILAVVVAPKADILNNTTGEFPVVFVATRPDILS